MKAPYSDRAKLCEALGNVFKRNRKKWLGYLASFLDNRGDADDVLQEAVGRVLARALPFSSEDQLRMYLSRAINNTAIEFYHLRRKERIYQRPLDLSTYADDERGSPEDMLERTEQDVRHEKARHLMRAGLSKLPPKQYEALCLTYLSPEGNSIREAGASRGIPYSTLRHRSIQGIRRLRRYVCRGLGDQAFKIRQDQPRARCRCSGTDHPGGCGVPGGNAHHSPGHRPCGGVPR